MGIRCAPCVSLARHSSTYPVSTSPSAAPHVRLRETKDDAHVARRPHQEARARLDSEERQAVARASNRPRRIRAAERRCYFIGFGYFRIFFLSLVYKTVSRLDIVIFICLAQFLLFFWTRPNRLSALWTRPNRLSALWKRPCKT